MGELIAIVCYGFERRQHGRHEAAKVAVLRCHEYQQRRHGFGYVLDGFLGCFAYEWIH